MTLEEIRKDFELRTQGWNAEISQVETGVGSFLYLAVNQLNSEERLVLGVQLEKNGKIFADVCGEDSGKIYSNYVEIVSLNDLDPLFELIPKPWMEPVLNIHGIERLTDF